MDDWQFCKISIHENESGNQQIFKQTAIVRFHSFKHRCRHVQGHKRRCSIYLFTESEEHEAKHFPGLLTSMRQSGRQGLLPPGQHLTHDSNIPHVSSAEDYFIWISFLFDFIIA